MLSFRKISLPIILLIASICSAEDKEHISATKLKSLLSPWQARIEASQRKSVRIKLVRTTDDVTISKVGGTPYIPAGHSVPTNSAGKNMFLLAQINFAEMPHLEAFPTKGILQFFISAGDFYGAHLDGPLTESNLSLQKDFRVVFHETLSGQSANFTYADSQSKDDALPFSPRHPLKMVFNVGTEIVGADDFEFESIIGFDFYGLLEKLTKESGLDEEILQEALEEYFSPELPIGKIGGYASFTQEDPRPTGSKKRLLFQLSSSSDDKLSIMWGDMGIGGFFIDPDRLKKGDFSEVMYTWDCG